MALTLERSRPLSESAAERRRVRYALVPPDKVQGQEIGQLQQGDEVELLGDRRRSLKVRTPTRAIG